MNRITFLVIAMILCSGLIYAQVSPPQFVAVTFTVSEVTSIEILQPTIDMSLRSEGRRGSIYEPSERNVPFNITVNTSPNRPKKLYASLNQQMPNEMTLQLRAILQGNRSDDYVNLDTTPRALLSGMTSVKGTGQLIFRLDAKLGAPASAMQQQRVVTLTISD